MDSKKRSWVKSIMWRVIGILILGLISYWITGDWKEVTGITVLFHSIRLVLYYFHERIWENIAWGRKPYCKLPLTRELTSEEQAIVMNTLKSLQIY
jgi:uncharacterized membrane protein